MVLRLLLLLMPSFFMTEEKEHSSTDLFISEYSSLFENANLSNISFSVNGFEYIVYNMFSNFNA